MYYLETGSLDPAYNLAFEEYVLCNRLAGDYLLLWQNESSVIIGLNQNTKEEINEAFVSEHGIKVVRRTTGGGAVYHDLGNLNYSFITDCQEDADQSVHKFTAAVADALISLGIRAEASGRNDILADGKKVSGTAQRIAGNRILYHGTLLFDVNAEMMEGALRPDPLKFQSRSTKSVRSRVGSIREALKGGPWENITLQEFRELIRERLQIEDISDNSLHKADAGALQGGLLTNSERKEVLALKASKYDTWEWNYGRSPAYSFCHKRRFPGGTLEVCMEIDQGLIAGLRLHGDFLSKKDPKELCERLCGIPCRREAVYPALSETDLAPYLGGITKEELFLVMFPDT